MGPSHMETKVRMCVFYPIAAGSDFTPAIVPLVFGPSSPSEMCTSINITQDSILEMVEDFSLQLNTADPAVLRNPRTAMVTIVDVDDGKLITHSWHNLILCAQY